MPENTAIQQEGRQLRVPISEHATPPAHIWSVRNMLVWVDEIEQLLSAPVNYSDMEALCDRLATLASHYASSTAVLASAKWYLATARSQSYDFVYQRVKSLDPKIAREMGGVISAANVKAYINDRCADLIWLEATADRLNSAITHSAEIMRSLLSKGKVDKQLSTYAQQVRGSENGY